MTQFHVWFASTGPADVGEQQGVSDVRDSVGLAEREDRDDGRGEVHLHAAGRQRDTRRRTVRRRKVVRRVERPPHPARAVQRPPHPARAVRRRQTAILAQQVTHANSAIPHNNNDDNNEPITVENLGVFISSTTLNFISELGRRICVHTGDARETS